MDHDRKQTDKENKLDAAKQPKPESSEADDPQAIGSAPPAIDQPTEESNEGTPDAAEQSDASDAVGAEPENEIGQFDDGEPASDPVASEPADQSTITAGTVDESDANSNTAEPAIDVEPPISAIADNQEAVASDVIAPPTFSAISSEPSTETSFDTTEAESAPVGDASPQPASPTFVMPPSYNAFFIDAARFSPPDFGDAGRAPHIAGPAPPKDDSVIDDLVHRPGDLGSIERLPFIPERDPDGPKFHDLFDRHPPSSDQNAAPFPSDAGPSEQISPAATDDDQSGLMCPVVLVEVVDAQIRPLIEELLVSAASNDFKTLSEIAKEEVEDAFWIRECHERAVYRD